MEDAEKTSMASRIDDLIQSGAARQVNDILSGVGAGDLADLLRLLPPDQAAAAFDLVPDPSICAEAVSLMDSTSRFSFFKVIGPARSRETVRHMGPEQSARVLGHLPADLAGKLMGALDDRRKEQTLRLMELPKKSAGRIMTLDPAILPKTASVVEALALLAQRLDRPPVIHAVDDKGVFIGSANRGRLLAADSQDTLDQVVDPSAPRVHLSTARFEAAVKLFRNKALCMPVLDESGKPVGQIEPDAAADEIADGGSRHLGQSLGVTVKPRGYSLALGSWTARWAQAGGLFVLLLLAVGAGWSILHSLPQAQALQLAVFMPLAAGVALHQGMLSYGYLSRGLATGDLNSNRIFRLIVEEIRPSLRLGLLFGGVAFCCIWLMIADPWPALAVGAGLFVASPCASLTGTLCALLPVRFGIAAFWAPGPVVGAAGAVLGTLAYLFIGAPMVC